MVDRHREDICYLCGYSMNPNGYGRHPSCQRKSKKRTRQARQMANSLQEQTPDKTEELPDGSEIAFYSNRKTPGVKRQERRAGAENPGVAKGVVTRKNRNNL